MKNKNGKLFRFVHDGVVDLDECIYPRNENVVFPVEAKIECNHTDMSWHKLAFPCYRFIDNSLALRTYRTGSYYGALPRYARNNKTKIIPIYCLFNPTVKTAYIYVFPEIRIVQVKRNDYRDVENGVILNDARQFKPTSVFQISMKRIMD